MDTNDHKDTKTTNNNHKERQNDTTTTKRPNNHVQRLYVCGGRCVFVSLFMNRWGYCPCCHCCDDADVWSSAYNLLMLLRR